MNDKTESYSVVDIDAIEIKKVLDYVYEALEERGYHPTNQLVGYLISGVIFLVIKMLEKRFNNLIVLKYLVCY